MPRDNDAEYNKLETELAKLKAEAKAARGNADSEEEREEIEEIATKAKVKAKTIKGASESSIHAALEEIRALRADLADKYNILPASNTAPAPAKTDSTSSKAEDKEWSLADLFF